MRLPHLRITPRSWLPLPRRTARLRLTTLYTGLFLVSGAALLTATYLLVRRTTRQGQIAGGGPNPPPSRQVEQARATAAVAHLQRISDLNHLLIDSGIALGILTLVAVALGWWVAGRVLRPLATITATARRISASNLHQRLALHGPDDELKDLADTLDGLFTRLEASFQAQRHFVANASHELRTPITRERTLLQVALADPSTSDLWHATGQELLASNREQGRLIEALLTLASSESGLDQPAPLDLSTLTNDTLTHHPRPGTDHLGLRINADTRPTTVDGDALLLKRLVANLIDNAVRHNIPGGHVHITTSTDHDHAVLTVTNTGPIISPAELDRLFHPFQRLHPRIHHGHGLGLSIVQAITAAHHATLTTHAPADGGLTITITFPPPANPNGAAGTTSPLQHQRAARAARAQPDG